MIRRMTALGLVMLLAGLLGGCVVYADGYRPYHHVYVRDHDRW